MSSVCFLLTGLTLSCAPFTSSNSVSLSTVFPKCFFCLLNPLTFLYSVRFYCICRHWLFLSWFGALLSDPFSLWSVYEFQVFFLFAFAIFTKRNLMQPLLSCPGFSVLTLSGVTSPTLFKLAHFKSSSVSVLLFISDSGSLFSCVFSSYIFLCLLTSKMTKFLVLLENIRWKLLYPQQTDLHQC